MISNFKHHAERTAKINNVHDSLRELLATSNMEIIDSEGVGGIIIPLRKEKNTEFKLEITRSDDRQPNKYSAGKNYFYIAIEKNDVFNFKSEEIDSISNVQDSAAVEAVLNILKRNGYGHLIR